MSFKVVDIPEVDSANTQLINALKDNMGKAIEIPLGGKDSNAYRKIIRAGLQSRRLLSTYSFHSRVSTDGLSLIIWIKAKTSTLGSDAEATTQGSSV